MKKVRTRIQVPKCLCSSLEGAPYKISMIESKLGNVSEAHIVHSKAISIHSFTKRSLLSAVMYAEQV